MALQRIIPDLRGKTDMTRSAWLLVTSALAAPALAISVVLSGPGAAGDKAEALQAAAAAQTRPEMTGAVLAALVEGHDRTVLYSPQGVTSLLSLIDRAAGAATAPDESAATDLPRGVRQVRSVWIDAASSKVPPTVYSGGLADTLGAEVAILDLAREGASRINAWAERATGGQIRHLMDTVPAGTRGVLADVLSLRALWATAFPAGNTSPGPFRRPDGSEVTARFMLSDVTYPAVRVGAAWAVALPFDGATGSGLFRVLLVLPDADADAGAVPDFAAIEAVLDHADTGRPVQVALPRIALETEAALDAPLRAAGYGPALAQEMSLIAPGLHPDAVLQRVRIEIDETGARAAAATTALGTRSLAIGVPEVLRFDRPFFFAVSTGADAPPLFVGRISDPAG